MLQISRFTKQLLRFNPSNQRLFSLPKSLQYSSLLNFSATSSDDGALSVSTDTSSTIPPIKPVVEMWTPPVPKPEPEKVEMVVPPIEQDPKPEVPKAPTSEDCCMSGCRVCVYDLWDIKCEKYLKALDQWNARERIRQGLGPEPEPKPVESASQESVQESAQESSQEPAQESTS